MPQEFSLLKNRATQETKEGRKVRGRLRLENEANKIKKEGNSCAYGEF